MSLHLKIVESKRRWLLFSLFSIYILSLFFQSFFIEREQFGLLFLMISFMSIAYFVINQNIKNYTIKQLLIFTTLMYGVCLFADSPLSNDYFRFIWDGEIISKGINPYDYKPNELILRDDFKENSYFLKLHIGMGKLSAQHYSCYPNINQFYFWFASIFSNSIIINLIILRILILITIIIGLTFITRLFSNFGIRKERIWLIILNPLFLLETIQNVHFEGVMITFLIMSIYYFTINSYTIGSFLLAVSIQIKLIPFIIFPFILKRVGFKKTMIIWILTIVFTLFIFSLLINYKNYSNFMSSIKLYFENFEFNSSLYYVIQKLTSHKFYTSIGLFLGSISLITIVIIALNGEKYTWNKLMRRLTIAFFIYYLLASTVHPWYLLVPLVLSIFTNFRFMLIWSILVFLSYSKYADLSEITVRLLTLIEYLTIVIFFILEMKLNSKSICELESCRDLN